MPVVVVVVQRNDNPPDADAKNPVFHKTIADGLGVQRSSEGIVEGELTAARAVQFPQQPCFPVSVDSYQRNANGPVDGA